MKKIGGLVLASVVIGALSFLVAKAFMTQAILNATRSPFTIHFRQWNTTAATAHKVNARNVIYAVRSDGSTVEAELDVTADQPVILSRTLRLVAERKRVLIFEKTQSTTTEYVPTSAVAEFKQSPPSATCIDPGLNGQYQMVGTGELLGYRVIKLRHHEGDMFEHWAAPDLNCEWIYSRTELKNPDGSVYETVEFIPLSIRPGEPAPDLFAIKPVYFEQPPSAAYGAASGQQVSGDLREKLAARDRVYLESQKFAPR